MRVEFWCPFAVGVVEFILGEAKYSLNLESVILASPIDYRGGGEGWRRRRSDCGDVSSIFFSIACIIMTLSTALDTSFNFSLPCLSPSLRRYKGVLE